MSEILIYHVPTGEYLFIEESDVDYSQMEAIDPVDNKELYDKQSKILLDNSSTMILANEEVFNEYRRLELEISRIKGIVQNTQPISNSQIAEWHQMCLSIEKKLSDLNRSTARDIMKLIAVSTTTRGST